MHLRGSRTARTCVRACVGGAIACVYARTCVCACRCARVPGYLAGHIVAIHEGVQYVKARVWVGERAHVGAYSYAWVHEIAR